MPIFKRMYVAQEAFRKMLMVAQHAVRRRESVHLTPEEINAVRATFDVRRSNPEHIRDHVFFLAWVYSDASIAELVTALESSIKERDVRGRLTYLIEVRIAGVGSLRDYVEITPLVYESLLDWLEYRPIKGEYIFTPVKLSSYSRFTDTHVTPFFMRQMLQRHFALAKIPFKDKPSTSKSLAGDDLANA